MQQPRTVTIRAWARPCTKPLAPLSQLAFAAPLLPHALPCSHHPQAEYHAALLPALPHLDARALGLLAHSLLALRCRPGEALLEALGREALGRMEAAAGGMGPQDAARLLHFAAAAEMPVSRDWMQVRWGEGGALLSLCGSGERTRRAGGEVGVLACSMSGKLACVGSGGLGMGASDGGDEARYCAVHCFAPRLASLRASVHGCCLPVPDAPSAAMTKRLPYILMSLARPQSFFLHTLPLLDHSFAEEPDATLPPATATSPASTFTPDHVALMLRALAVLGYRPPDTWLHAALRRLRSEAARLSPACFPIALTALARIAPDVAGAAGSGEEVSPGGAVSPGTNVTTGAAAAAGDAGDSWVDAMVRAAHNKRESFTSMELRWLLDCLGTSYPSYVLVSHAESNLLFTLRTKEMEEAAGWAEGRAPGQGPEGGEGDVAGRLGQEVGDDWLDW